MTAEPSTVQRQTKYCLAIESLLLARGHATNAEILCELRVTYPELSATTVHRATARLCSRGHIATAPADSNGAMRFDSNISPHDHFLCAACGTLRDIDIIDAVLPQLRTSVDDCDISGRLTIYGMCKKCIGDTL